MGEVVGFKPAPKDSDYLWRCNCGCTSFSLLGDGTARCHNCDAEPSDVDGEWRKPLPGPEIEAAELDPSDFRVTDMFTSEASLKRTIEQASVNATAFVVVAQSDGAISVWGEISEDPEHVAWCDRRLSDARKFLIKD